MKNSKQIFSIIVLTAFIVPQITFAAWWNPLTWFSRTSPAPMEKAVEVASENIKENQEDIVQEEIPVADNAATNQPPSQQTTERVVERPVVQTVTVVDPALQARINTLIAQNDTLMIENAKLIQQIRDLQNAQELRKESEAVIKPSEPTSEQLRLTALENEKKRQTEYNQKLASIERELIEVDKKRDIERQKLTEECSKKSTSPSFLNSPTPFLLNRLISPCLTESMQKEPYRSLSERANNLRDTRSKLMIEYEICIHVIDNQYTCPGFTLTFPTSVND